MTLKAANRIAKGGKRERKTRPFNNVLKMNELQSNF